MKKIVTDRDLEALARDGVVEISGDMILTPSARDLAVNKGIRLEYASERKEKPSSSPSTEDDLEAAIREIVAAELGESGADIRSAITSEVRAQLTQSPVSSTQATEKNTGLPPSVEQAVTTVLSAAHTSSENARAVVTIAGENHSGVVASVSAVISDMDYNIVDISQTVIGMYFTMILVVDIQDLEARGLSFHAFREAVQEAARAAGVAANVMHENILQTMHRVI